MRRGGVGALAAPAAGLLAAMLCAALVAASDRRASAGADTATSPGARATPPRVRTVTFGIRHRVFPEFAQLSEVRMREIFPVGDSPYTARAVEFLPDFSLNLDTRKVIPLSHEPRNPAFRVVVLKNGVPSDTTWAFLNMPPHFARTSMLAFQVLRIDFANRPPMTARDTTLLLRGRR